MDELTTLLEQASALLLSSDLPTASTMLRLAEVDWTTEVGTAAMAFDRRTARASIALNPDFVSQHAERPLRLAALVLHELFHHLLHHYVLYPSDQITNLAQDMIINALICRLSPSLQQLFTEFYDKHTFPSMFLRPGANLRRIKNDELRTLALSTYYRLYRKSRISHWAADHYRHNPDKDQETITVDELAGILMRMRKTQKEIVQANIKAGLPEMEGLEGMDPDWWKEGPPLLGEHPKDAGKDPFDSEGLEDEHAHDFDSFLGDLQNDLTANGNASALFQKAFNIDTSSAPNELLDAMQSSMREDILRMKQIVEGVIGPRPNNRTIIPRHVGRKEVLLLASGIFPVFYPAFGPDENPGGDVIIYIDVSGSMGDQAPFLLMLLTAFKEQIATEFYQFSTVIAPTNFADFVREFESSGRIVVQTNGGTAFDPIFEHAEKMGYRKILLITDGCAGLSEQYSRFAEDIETYTVFTRNHNIEPLGSVSRNTWVMPALTNPKG